MYSHNKLIRKISKIQKLPNSFHEILQSFIISLFFYGDSSRFLLNGFLINKKKL